MLFKIQKHFSSIEIVNEQEHLIQKLAFPLCYEKNKTSVIRLPEVVKFHCFGLP